MTTKFCVAIIDSSDHDVLQIVGPFESRDDSEAWFEERVAHAPGLTFSSGPICDPESFWPDPEDVPC